jgi:hypothetical protein
MGTLDQRPAMDNPQNQNGHDETLPGDGGTLTAESGVAPVELIDNHLADNDLLAAITPLSDGLENIDHTLDQLTSVTNLFDVPAFDLDSPTDS